MNTLDARMLSAVDQTLARALSRLYLARAALPFSVGNMPYEARCEAHAVQAAAQAYRFTLGDAPGWLLLDAAAERHGWPTPQMRTCRKPCAAPCWPTFWHRSLGPSSNAADARLCGCQRPPRPTYGWTGQTSCR